MASFLKVDQIQSDSGNVALTGNVTTQSTAVVNFGDGQFIKTAAGNIGIGTSSPTARLDVRRADADGLIAEFHQSSGFGINIGSSSSVAYLEAEFNQALSFRTGSTSTERMRIAADGSFSSVIPGGTTMLPEFKCRAWVNFNGTGTVAIRASGNVSSITDNGVGNYTVNFTTAMPDNKYVPISDVVRDYDQDVNNGYSNIGTVTTTTFKILTGQSSAGNSVDWEGVFAMVVR